LIIVRVRIFLGATMPNAKAHAEFADVRRQGYYSIGQAAAISGLTAKMIRHYERLGLMPKAMRTLGDYRIYSAMDLHTLRFIRRARNLGFTVEEIRTLLSLWRNQRRASEQVKRLATQHLAELDQRIAALQAMRAALADLAEHCHGDDRPECPILDDLSRLPPAH
jgi:MerR family copper efflux transcriptional regulator